MLKQSLLYLLLSILIVVFAEYAHLLMVYIVMFYTWVMLKITPVFHEIRYGLLIRNVLSLVLIPVIIAGIPALVYRLIKGKQMPGFVELTWILWLMIVLGKVLIR
jgi:hypothetical protein